MTLQEQEEAYWRIWKVHSYIYEAKKSDKHHSVYNAMSVTLTIQKSAIPEVSG